MTRPKRPIVTGILWTPAIRAAIARDDILYAQRLILELLSRELDGPRTVARKRRGRKVLQAVA